MGVQDPNSTNYVHPHESHLLDLHNAMTYNALGEPVLRTTSGAAATANDAFGRLRVSNPFTLFDSFHRFQDNGRIGASQAGNATSTFDSNSGTILSTVTGQIGDLAIRESNRVFAYQPGKSLQVIETFCLAAPQVGLRQRYGYFDVSNGIYLEQDGLNYYIVRRSSSSGTLDNHRISQSDWNVDPLTGAGISRKTIDLTKAQIFWMDIEWLGVGSVRCGFVIDGEFVQVHQFNHANSVTTTYMTTACLPVRCEIENTATNNMTSSLRTICATVISEGGYELRGKPHSIGHELASPRTNTNQQTEYRPVLSIRLKADRLGAIVIPKNFSIAPTIAKNYSWRLISNAVTANGQWFSAGDDSCVEYNLTATSYSNGTVLEQGYIIVTNQSGTAVSLQDYPFKFQLERNTLTSPATRYEFIIAVACTDAGGTVSSLNWEEIT
jgi:hypothetical protein